MWDSYVWLGCFMSINASALYFIATAHLSLPRFNGDEIPEESVSPFSGSQAEYT